METILILGALAACAAVALVVAAMTARGRRAPLRLSNELDEADEVHLLGGIEPRATPIDRSADILDLDPVSEERPHRRGGTR